MYLEPKVDLRFHIRGRTLPVDHGFALYGAISKICPNIHEDEGIGVKLISGKYIGNGLLDITPASELVIRLHAHKIGQYINLAGKTLDLLGEKVYVGIPNTKMLHPAAELYAHLVTTKNGNDQVRFEGEIDRQVKQLGIEGIYQLLKRRTFKVHEKQIVGYSLLVSKLNSGSIYHPPRKRSGWKTKNGLWFLRGLAG